MKQNQAHIPNDILQDVRANGYHVDWDKKRRQAIFVGQVLINAGVEYHSKKLIDRGEKMQQCGDFLTFVEDAYGNRKYLGTRRCKDRLCPLCNWLNSRRNFTRLHEAVQGIDIEKNQPIFITLTVPNCVLRALNETLRDIHKSFTRMMNKSCMKKRIVGYYRATEVTYDSKTDTFHPHIHALLFCVEDYFDKDKNLYMSGEEWKRIWMESLDTTDSRSICVKGVKKTKGDKSEQDIDSALSELSKYIFKPTNNIPNEHIPLYGYQVKGIRFTSAGGLIKTMLDSVDRKPLMSIKSLDGMDADSLQVIQYVSSGQGYKKCNERTPEEWKQEVEFRRQMKKNRIRRTNIPFDKDQEVVEM